ncbi:hypothetical protein HD554DRAFT_2175465 [Boletus coccyginus]|nr:hypothetical protein HD554DRAFT_2175465 [Boletus coccyginus]
MPPTSYPSRKRCFCEGCIEKGGRDMDGKPRGMLMEARLIPPHLKHLQDEHSAQCSSASVGLQLPTGSGADAIAGHLFDLTLTDDGPDPVALANKLKRAQAVSRLTLQTTLVPPPLSPLATHSNVSEHHITSQPPPSCLPPTKNATSLASSSASPVSVIGGRRSPKKHRNRRTIKALQILSNIESCIQRCCRLLLDPSNISYHDIQHELVTLRRTVDKVTREMESVMVQRRTLIALLDELTSQVQVPANSSPQGPVEIDIEKEYRLPMKRMDTIPQVALVLGVVCSIIFGVSTPGANFVMSGLSLLLYLAFQKSNGTLSTSHENVMRQIPSSIGGALAKHQRPSATSRYSDYLATLLSRPDIEAMMDSACDDLHASLPSAPCLVKNPFEAQSCKNFVDQSLKSSSSIEEMRVVMHLPCM